MKKREILFALGAVAILTFLVRAVTPVQLGWQQEEEGLLPELPEQSTGVRDLLLAQPFVLEESYVHSWRSESPAVKAGYLLVLEVEEPFTVPRNTLEAVLLVGDQTAERINWGTGSGQVVALVPAPLSRDGLPSLDLGEVLMFYGSAELPERVDATWIQTELERAYALGLRPFAAERIQAARAAGGLLRLRDRSSLLRHAANLVLERSPAEEDLARGFLAPLIR